MFIIHAWEIDGFVKVSSGFTEYIYELIISKFVSVNKFSKICGINRKAIEGVCQRNKNHKGFIKTFRLFRLTDYLKINRKYVEKQIEFYADSKTGGYNRIYKINFPLIVTPLVFRLVAHVIGDGTISSGSLRYSQQSTKYIRRLSENIVKPINRLPKSTVFNKDKSFKEEQFTIPMFLGKCVFSILKINKNQIKSKQFIEKCLKLPKDFRVQILAAIIVDEGSIEGKTIRMKDKKIMDAICKLIDSLEYKRGKLTSTSRILTYKEKFYEAKLYTIQLWAEGLRDFLNDINSCIRRYGHSASLWNKQKAIKNKVNDHDYEYIKNFNKFQQLREQVIDILKTRKIITLKDMIEKFNINRDRMEYLFKTLVKQKMAIRIARGVYSYERKK